MVAVDQVLIADDLLFDAFAYLGRGHWVGRQEIPFCNSTNFGRAAMALIVSTSAWTVAGGVRDGANHPYQASITILSSPCSLNVATSGKAARRALLLTASTRAPLALSKGRYRQR